MKDSISTVCMSIDELKNLPDVSVNIEHRPQAVEILDQQMWMMQMINTKCTFGSEEFGLRSDD